MFPLACAVPLACAAVPEPAAAPELPEAPVWLVRPPGELITWSNRVPDVRVPIELQPLREPGNRALLPPRSTRDALQPRLAATLEANDNVLLTADAPQRGAALLVSPGVNWLQQGPRHRVEVDASVEAIHRISGPFDGARLDAATLLVNASGQPSATTALDYAGAVLHLHDPTGATPTGPAAGSAADQRYASDYQRHQLSAGLRLDPRTDLGARWLGTWARSSAPDFVRTRGQDIELSARWQFSATRRFGLQLRGREARFATLPAARYASATVEVEQQWSRTLQAQIAIGAATGTGGDRLALWRGSLTQTFADGQWDLAFERDVSQAAGLGRMFELRSARIGGAWRVGHRSRLELSWQAAQYRPREGGAAVQVVRPRLSFTVPLTAQSWLNLRLLHSDDQVPETGLRREGNRLLVSVVQTF